LNGEPEGLPVNEYLKPQGRFAYLREGDIERIQESVDREWKRLVSRMENRPAWLFPGGKLNPLGA
ncbi:MAG: hypothetical protein NTY64_05860, partial [Deltaproteobacteria bacterium]|nr:hypothetical protein [Deltaproteobacteria bacterium]